MMSKQCQPFLDQIAPYLMEDLSPEARQALQEHLPHCASCREELDSLSMTLEEMRLLEDVQVPRPFYILPEADERGPGGWRGWLALWPPRLAVGALSLLLLVASLAFAGFQLRLEDGVLTAGFGQLPSQGMTPGEVKALAQMIWTQVDQRLEEHDGQVRAALELSLSEFWSDLDERQRKQLQAGLSQFQQVLGQSWERREAGLRSDVQQYVDATYGRWRSLYETDIEAVGRTLTQVSLRDRAQEERIDLLSGAILQLAGGDD